MKSLLTALLLLAASPALADAASAFREGKWQAAVTAGHAEATPASLIIAARSQMAIAAWYTKDRSQALALITEAERDLDAALAKAPGNVEAQLQKAVAIGYRAKLTKSPGLAKDARRRFEAIRSAHPDNATAWAAVGGWHAGAISTLGSFMASAVVGAKSSEIDANFQKAFRLDPNNPVHRNFYALALMDLSKSNGAKAATALQGVGQMPVSDGFEALSRAQGVQLAAALKAGDMAAAQQLARRLQAFGGLE
jgi:tetratricopeptide (TPR) repeat protein